MNEYVIALSFVNMYCNTIQLVMLLPVCIPPAYTGLPATLISSAAASREVSVPTAMMSVASATIPATMMMRMMVIARTKVATTKERIIDRCPHQSSSFLKALSTLDRNGSRLLNLPGSAIVAAVTTAAAAAAAAASSSTGAHVPTKAHLPRHYFGFSSIVFCCSIKILLLLFLKS